MLCLPNKTLLYSYAFHFMLTCANAYGLLGFIKRDVTKCHVMQRHITLAQGLDGYDNPHYMKYYEQTCRVDFDPQSLAAPPYAVYNNMKVSSDSDTSDSDTTDTTDSDARMQSSCFCFHDPDNADHQPPFPASLGWPAYAPYTRRRRHGQGNATAAPAAAAGANGRPLKWFGKTPIVGVYTHQGEDRLWTSIPDSLSGGEDVAGGEMHSRSDSEWVEWDHFCDAFADELMSLNASSSSSSFANERSSSSTSTNTAGSSRSNEIILEHVANGTSGVECKALCEAATTASIRNGGRQRWCEAFVATEAGECFLLQKLVYLSTECNTNAFGGDDPAPNKPKYCECNHIGTITCPAGYHYYRQPGWTSGPGEGKSDCAIGCPGNLALPGCAPTQAPAPASVGACRYDGRFGHCGYDCYKINNVYDCDRCSHTSADCESQRREELDPSRPRCACELSTSTTTPNVVLEWKSTTTATTGWTLDESKSDKSRVDQSIWPKFETKKDSSSTNANYDLLLFPAGTYTLVQSDGSSSSDDNNVNVWLGSQAAVDPHATRASGFVAMIMQGVAAWNGWPSFTDYHCLSPHVSTKCADSPRVDAVTFTLMEPTWLRPVYSNNYNAHDSRCQITLTFLPLSEAVPLSADPRNANSLVYANASMLLDDGWTFDAADVDVDFAVDDGTDGTDSVRACRLDACTVDGILDPSCCAGGASSKRTAGCETMSRYAQMDGTRLPHAYL